MKVTSEDVESWCRGKESLLEHMRGKHVRTVITMSSRTECGVVGACAYELEDGTTVYSAGDRALFEAWAAREQFFCSECGAPLTARWVDEAWSIDPCKPCIRLESEAIADADRIAAGDSFVEASFDWRD